ncbi:MAG TPA: winged helix-turn-helix domain-containing protein [Sphingomonas sp.]|uniref:winged helix-turn-helix domain-containing protein n=1 Tax=Sphingomonas sp. TaxID=28214 RepID=UPI002CC31E65|nr:winged helix-turn-helix domain-containing protein [Sphingomonas sp.]HMI19523.1 winged helix-turn-helix domain-containing protein [Sphingomonas sp.]
MTPTRRFTIGAFGIDPGRNVVAGPDGEATLEPKIMDVLCLLANHPGEVLSRETIIDRVWGHAFGADESLTRAISRLRKVFGDARTPAQVIETISKRGYRLIAPVTIETEEPAEPRLVRRWRWIVPALVLLAILAAAAWYRLGSAPPASPATEGLQVSIKPFDVLGPADAVAARALSDQVSMALSRASLLHVGKGNAPASDGGQAYAVRGSVAPLASGIRITISLLDARSGENLWAGNFDRPAAMDAAAQDELAGAIAGELTDRLLVAAKSAIRRKPPLSLKPWELILLATWVPGSDEVFLQPHKADALWPQQRALQLDPDYAPAHASLASALAYRAMFTPGVNVAALRSAAARHAEQAKAHAPYDAGVLYELATYYRLIGDRNGAHAALERVLALQPNHPVARYDLPFVDGLCTARGAASVGALDALLGRLSTDNPVRWVILSHLADLQLAQGNYATAADAAGRSRQIVRMTWSGITLAAALAKTGQVAAAREVSNETKLEWPGLDWRRFAVPVWCLGGVRQAPAAAAFRQIAAIEQAR